MIKINFRQSRTAYLITGILFLTSAAAAVITDIILRVAGNESVSIGNYPVIFPALVGIFIPALNFPKLINLGGTRMDFFRSCMFTYAIAAGATALFCLILRLFLDPFMTLWVAKVDNLFDVFGFMRHGPVVAFLQMAAFLLFTSCAAHTLTLAQGRWYGWLADGLIIAAISLTAVAPVRSAWIGFFNLIIFNDYAAVQIISCVVLSAAIYALSLIPLAAKRI
jgi:hypothetical protein